MEFLELVGPLTNPAAHGGDPADAFDVVVPALPGFGFGGAPREGGWGVSRIAAAFDALMTRELGYERYAAQGGDWGSMIAAKLGASYPERVAGIHVNFLVVPPPRDAGPQDADALERLRALAPGRVRLRSSSRAPSPTRSRSRSPTHPAGLATWIVEKFRAWSDCDGAGEIADRN